MSNIPFENHTICDINELYGRSGILKKLLYSVDERHDCVNVVGCRRFGKTCLLETLVASIRNKENAQSYPIYIDSKSWNIGFPEHGTIGTFNVYRYLLAIILEDFTNKGFIKEEFLIRDLIISPVYDRHVFYEKIKQYNSSSIADTFADAIRKFSQILRKTIVLVFDEYEFLMTKAFSESTGFQTLRKLSSETFEGIRPFSYLVAGAVTWEHLCSSIGSKELNTIGSHIHYVKPLKYDVFKIFWNHECEKIDDDELKSKIINQVDLVFERCGGVPFHANDMGSYLISNDGEFAEGYIAIIDEVFESLTENQKKLLVEIEQTQNIVNKGKDLIILRQLGLVKPDEAKLTIGFLKDYIQNELPVTNTDFSNKKDNNSSNESFDIEGLINAIHSNAALEMSSDAESKERKLLVAEIVRLWDGVIKAYKTNAPFTPSSRDTIEFSILEKPCTDDGSLKAFATSLCILYYEGSDLGKRLPSTFLNHDFCKIIRSLRNKSDHGDNKYEARIMNDDELYSLINNGIFPFNVDHFKNIQSTLLNLFRSELELMLKKSPKDRNTNTARFIAREIQTESLEEGKIYEGIITEYNSFLNVKCTQYPYPLMIKSQIEDVYVDEVVVFRAHWEPNRKDPDKKFWYAEDVHLKN